jgi:hypothetical protein
MSKRTDVWIATIALAIVSKSVGAAALRAPCDESLTRSIPVRAPTAPGGHAFGQQIRGLPDDEREARIRQELLTGNIPDFLRRLVPVRLSAPLLQVEVVICAAPDYLAIGSDDDFLLIPMRLGTALTAASHFGFTLPTPHMVDAIYAQAPVHFVPQPLPAGNEMRSTEYSLHHNELIGAQRAALEAPLGTLSAGDKKDLVLTNRLWSHLDRVAIYGWHLTEGKPIQSLSTVHGWRYQDYSHGARLISTQVFIDDRRKSIFEVMQDPRLAAALSGEGAIENVIELIEKLDEKARDQIAAALMGAPSRQP